MARFFVYSTKEAAAALKEAHIPYRVHGEYCISVNNNDYSTAVEAFFRNDVSFNRNKGGISHYKILGVWPCCRMRRTCSRSDSVFT